MNQVSQVLTGEGPMRLVPLAGVCEGEMGGFACAGGRIWIRRVSQVLPAKARTISGFIIATATAADGAQRETTGVTNTKATGLRARAAKIKVMAGTADRFRSEK